MFKRVCVDCLATTTPRNCFCYGTRGACVTYEAVCDGNWDCPDGRDEWNCK